MLCGARWVDGGQKAGGGAGRKGMKGGNMWRRRIEQERWEREGLYRVGRRSGGRGKRAYGYADVVVVVGSVWVFVLLLLLLQRSCHCFWFLF